MTLPADLPRLKDASARLGADPLQIQGPGGNTSVKERETMWNSFRTDGHQAIVAGITTYPAGNGDLIHAYVARPEGDGPFPGMVAIHHMPGWDEFNQEFAERLARHGYAVLVPDLYCRVGHGSADDIAAKVRSQGGIPDDSVVFGFPAYVRRRTAGTDPAAAA